MSTLELGKMIRLRRSYVCLGIGCGNMSPCVHAVSSDHSSRCRGTFHRIKPALCVGYVLTQQNWINKTTVITFRCPEIVPRTSCNPVTWQSFPTRSCPASETMVGVNQHLHASTALCRFTFTCSGCFKWFS